MANDAIVKIGHIDPTVWPGFQIHGAKPGIFGNHQIGLFHCHRRRTTEINAISVDTACNHISQKDIALKFLGELRSGVDQATGNSCRSVVVLAHFGAVTQAIVGFAKAGIKGSSKEPINGPRVAIRRV